MHADLTYPPSSLSISYSYNIQGAAKKVAPKVFFAVFSATAGNFNMEFYRFIYRNVLHITDK